MEQPRATLRRRESMLIEAVSLTRSLTLLLYRLATATESRQARMLGCKPASTKASSSQRRTLDKSALYGA